VAKIERERVATLNTSAGPSKTNGPPPKMDRTDKKRNKNQAYAGKVENDDAWKNQLLSTIQDLRAAQQVGDARLQKIVAENGRKKKLVVFVTSNNSGPFQRLALLKIDKRRSRACQRQEAVN